MRSPGSLKQDFFKKWLMGMLICRSSIKNTSVSERKNAIKLSADVAMASVRNGTTCWSRAIIAKNASNNDSSKILVQRILSGIQCKNLLNNSFTGSKTACHKKILRRSKKILKHRCSTKTRTKFIVALIAKRLVKKRTQVLKSLVPGGELMNDETLLIQETLDYIVLLKAQVDVMRSLVDAATMNSDGK